MKKVWQWVYYAICAVLVVAALLLVATAFSIGGTRGFMVTSGSMQPAIKTGSIVFDVPQKSYQIGDVVTYGPISKAVEPTTHRITQIVNQNGQIIYHTKGDANNTADRRDIMLGDILGKVRLIVPYAGYAVAAVKTKLGFLIIIILPAVIVIIDELWNIWKEIKAKMTQKIKKEIAEGGDKPEK